ncbi:hypothetical protein Q3G72_034728 [Acer saccharum]|nr:hypothetical protein Q3G72_034728 [Acer saccharum]
MRWPCAQTGSSTQLRICYGVRFGTWCRGRWRHEATAATRLGGCSDDDDGDEGRAATTATGSGGFPPSSCTLTTATPSSSSVAR